MNGYLQCFISFLEYHYYSLINERSLKKCCVGFYSGGMTLTRAEK